MSPAAQKHFALTCKIYAVTVDDVWSDKALTYYQVSAYKCKNTPSDCILLPMGYPSHYYISDMHVIILYVRMII